MCFRKPREQADLVSLGLPSKGRVEAADGAANWVGYSTETASRNPRGGE